MATMTLLDNSVVPKWNEEPSTLDAFEEPVILYVLGTKKEERYLCGPRLLAQDGSRTTAVQGCQISCDDNTAGCGKWSDAGDCGSETYFGSSSNSRSRPSLSTVDGIT